MFEIAVSTTASACELMFCDDPAHGRNDQVELDTVVCDASAACRSSSQSGMNRILPSLVLQTGKSSKVLPSWSVEQREFHHGACRLRRAVRSILAILISWEVEPLSLFCLRYSIMAP